MGELLGQNVRRKSPAWVVLGCEMWLLVLVPVQQLLVAVSGSVAPGPCLGQNPADAGDSGLWESRETPA